MGEQRDYSLPYLVGRRPASPEPDGVGGGIGGTGGRKGGGLPPLRAAAFGVAALALSGVFAWRRFR
ncbi:hypothetical protein [Acidithiobacillus sp.]|uniref:hypothetical protein n=1 Tax=Acidithiobacillus sp. TaxID=1872118 RepID=UPI003D058748